MAVTPPSTPATRVAAAVKVAMIDKDFNTLRLAEASGIPRSTLMRRLDHGAPFTVEELGRVARVLDVDVITFLAPVDAA